MNSLKRHILRLTLPLIICVAASGVAAAQGKTVGILQKQQKQTQKEINETSKKLKDTDARTLRTMRSLNSISAEIGEHKKNITKMQADLDSINTRLNEVNDSMAIVRTQLDQQKADYGKAVKTLHIKARGLNRVNFVLTAGSLRQAFRRVRYLREYSRWQSRQLHRINQTRQNLHASQKALNSLVEEKNENLEQQNKQRRELEKKQGQQQRLVTKLKAESKQLKRTLNRKQQEARELDRAIDNIIEKERRAAEEREKKALEEQRKKEQKEQKEQKGNAKQKTDKKAAATKKPAAKSTESSAAGNASFESLKGRLPHPVSGQYKVVRRFGVQQHPQLPHVKTDNAGIDIETTKGASALAVHEGTVSAIFRHDGFNHVVMVRHGNYITIYVNISELSIKTGDKVKARQRLGKIYSDESDDGRTILHFEIRHETTKLNPSLWIQP